MGRKVGRPKNRKMLIGEFYGHRLRQLVERKTHELGLFSVVIVEAGPLGLEPIASVPIGRDC